MCLRFVVVPDGTDMNIIPNGLDYYMSDMSFVNYAPNARNGAECPWAQEYNIETNGADFEMPSIFHKSQESC